MISSILEQHRRCDVLEDREHSDHVEIAAFEWKSVTAFQIVIDQGYAGADALGGLSRNDLIYPILAMESRSLQKFRCCAAADVEDAAVPRGLGD